MLSYMTFDGVNCGTYDMYVTDAGIDEMPERDVSEYEIAGKDGTLIIDNGRYKNVPIRYPAVVLDNFRNNYDAYKEVLAKRSSNYFELHDGFTPNRYRMARFMYVTKLKHTNDASKATFDIVFDCKPQRYLVSGKSTITLTASGSINNPTGFPSKPLLRIYGTGSLEIGGTVITISTADGYTDIDCENMQIYKGLTSKSEYVTLSNEYPILPSGTSNVIFGAVTKVEIIPRWWSV